MNFVSTVCVRVFSALLAAPVVAHFHIRSTPRCLSRGSPIFTLSHSGGFGHAAPSSGLYNPPLPS
eukprot:5654456-Amphidinium_carterae.1